MTQPGRYDFLLEQGATFRRTFTWKIGDTVETAKPVDVSNFAARLMVRERIQDDEPLLSITDGDGITVGGEDGTFTIELSDEETASLDFAGPAFYDFEIESGDGVVARLLHGRVGLAREITREVAS